MEASEFKILISIHNDSQPYYVKLWENILDTITIEKSRIGLMNSWKDNCKLISNQNLDILQLDKGGLGREHDKQIRFCDVTYGLVGEVKPTNTHIQLTPVDSDDKLNLWTLEELVDLKNAIRIVLNIHLGSDNIDSVLILS